jgi:hypothetical protein
MALTPVPPALYEALLRFSGQPVRAFQSPERHDTAGAERNEHHPKLRTQAIRIGERLAVLIDYPASPGCTPPYAPVWIAEMVRRREET